MVIILFLHTLILLKTIFFPYPELFIYPYLTNIGLMPYKQILDQHFPGLMFFPVNFGSLGMDTPIQARLVLIVTVLTTQILIYLVGKKIFKSKKMALLACILYLIWQPFFEGWVLWIDTFLPLFLLPAFYFTYSGLTTGKRKDFFFGGMFIGMGIVFKQVLVPLAGLVFFILLIQKRTFKEIFWYTLGVIPAPLFMIFYIYSKGIFPDFWYWTVAFNFTTFAEFGRKYPDMPSLIRVIVVYGFAIFAFFNRKYSKTNTILSIFAIGSLFAAYARFDFVHFQPSLPFICLLSVIAFSYVWNKVKIIVPIYILGIIVLLPVFYQGHLGSKILFFDQNIYLIASKIESTTKPGDKIFIYGAPLHLYQITKTRPAGDVFVFQFPWFMMKSEKRVLEGLIKDKPKLVIADRSATTEGIKLIDFSSKINTYLLEEYETYDKIGSIEFLRPK